MKKIYTMLLSMLLLAGCSNYQELNEVALITTMGIDLSQEIDNGYRVTFQVINPSTFSPTSTSVFLETTQFNAVAPETV